jgi:hypothetical protein
LAYVTDCPDTAAYTIDGGTPCRRHVCSTVYRISSMNCEVLRADGDRLVRRALRQHERFALILGAQPGEQVLGLLLGRLTGDGQHTCRMAATGEELAAETLRCERCAGDTRPVS